jgi:hypothetical protein
MKMCTSSAPPKERSALGKLVPEETGLNVASVEMGVAPWVRGDAVSQLAPPSRNPNEETRHCNFAIDLLGPAVHTMTGMRKQLETWNEVG